MPKSALRKRRARAAGRRLRRNPDAAPVPVTQTAAGGIFVDTTAGLAGYALTRFVSRMVYSQAIKRWPNAAQHLHAAAGLLSFAGVWLLGGFWRRIGPYHQPAIVGSGIAAAQGILQSYIPKVAWLVSDCRRSDYMPVMLPPVQQIDDEGLLDETSTQADDPTMQGSAAQPNPPAQPPPTEDFSEFQQGIFGADNN